MDVSENRRIQNFVYASSSIKAINTNLEKAKRELLESESSLVDLLVNLEALGLPPRVAYGNDLLVLALREPEGEHYVQVLPFLQSYNVETEIAKARRSGLVENPAEELATVADV